MSGDLYFAALLLRKQGEVLNNGERLEVFTLEGSPDKLEHLLLRKGRAISTDGSDIDKVALSRLQLLREKE